MTSKQRYDRSEKGKARHRRYNAAPGGIARHARGTEERRLRGENTPSSETKEARAARWAIYSQRPEFKLSRQLGISVPTAREMIACL